MSIITTIRAKVPIKIRNGIDVELVTFNFQDSEFPDSEKEHIALLFKGYDKEKYPLIRIHSECLTGDVFGSHRCDCGFQLDETINILDKKGGVILYLRQEGRGIGLYNKIDAYKLQIENGLDTYDANCELGFLPDARNFKVAADMLKALNLNEIILLSNNPDKKNQLVRCGIDVKSAISTGTKITNDNKNYIKAKIKHGHKIDNFSKLGLGTLD